MNKRHDNDFDDGEKELEEQYQKMFKKIARDFAMLEDIKQIVSSMNAMLEIMRRIDPEVTSELEEELVAERNNAVLKAIEYKNNLEKPRSKRNNYKDVNDG
jgi:hypothetical protein